MKKHDLVGRRFGRLLVLRLHPTKPGPSKWECICDCGGSTIAYASNLLAGNSNSCGCLAKEKTSKRTKTHGRTDTTEYNIWHSMKLRCFNPKDKAYKNYGARGITMDIRWMDSFEIFLEEMGERPSNNHSIERRNNDLGYYKSNCYWATAKEQTDNRRVTVWLEHNGIKLPQADWAKKLGVTPSSILYHRKKGISFSEIVNIYSS